MLPFTGHSKEKPKLTSSLIVELGHLLKQQHFVPFVKKGIDHLTFTATQIDEPSFYSIPDQNKNPGLSLSLADWNILFPNKILNLISGG